MYWLLTLVGLVMSLKSSHNEEASLRKLRGPAKGGWVRPRVSLVTKYRRRNPTTIINMNHKFLFKMLKITVSVNNG